MATSLIKFDETLRNVASAHLVVYWEAGGGGNVKSFVTLAWWRQFANQRFCST